MTLLFDYFLLLAFMFALTVGLYLGFKSINLI